MRVTDRTRAIPVALILAKDILAAAALLLSGCALAKP